MSPVHRTAGCGFKEPSRHWSVGSLSCAVISACLALAAALTAAEPATAAVVQTVPSPSTAPGVRLWDPPAFTHWPAVMWRDETRHAAIGLPVQQASVTGTLGWVGGDAWPITLPVQTERIGGLLTLPTLGVDQDGRRLLARVLIGAQGHEVPLRLADVRRPWPISGLRGGFPVDSDGTSVVLVGERYDPAVARRWQMAKTAASRPIGAPLLVGDPLSALGASPWTGLDCAQRPATDARRPHHAVLAALATLPDPLPATIIWCPGNGAVAGGVWDPEEPRLIEALGQRLDALGAGPRLVLALPPAPIEERAAAVQVERRTALIRTASVHGWTIVDLAGEAGPAETANRVADGIFAPYPTGDAQRRMHAALAAALHR